LPKRADPWPSDRELVDKILGGSREHFDLLYNAYFPRVYRFALKRLGDPAEAEDVTQEVFVTVFRVLASYRGKSSLLVWIFGITRNTANRRFRSPRYRLECFGGTTARMFRRAMPRPIRPWTRAAFSIAART
jgi:RNA polymerase sigma-70 factor (ECF subfamily)